MAKYHSYHLALWNQDKPTEEYFRELERVSQNQIIWGWNNYPEIIGKPTQGYVVWDKQVAEGVLYADCELAYTSFSVSAKIFHFRWSGMLQEDMKNKEAKIHPTQKPVKLYEWLLKEFAKEGDKILDTHMGSGSSRIACYNMGFDYVGTEIDEIYFKKQEERWQQVTSQYKLF